MTVDAQGLLICSRYAFAPNSLHYCGPERQSDMLGYVHHASVDRGLIDILNRFETLYPYLVLIASENRIKDPFDPRVVEAYWLGNHLLGSVHTRSLVKHLEDTALLKRRLPNKKFASMMDEVVENGVPQHNFHVMNIYVRTGHLAIPHTVKTMDQCRISWGRVTECVNPTNKKTGARNYIVETRPLIYRDNRLQLGICEKRMVMGIGMKYNVGDWVSVHWGYVCGLLTPLQRRNLAYYTNSAIIAANRSHVVE